MMKNYTHQNIRKLTRIGKHSYAVIIPKDFIRRLNWKERQKLTLTLKARKVSIADYQK